MLFALHQYRYLDREHLEDLFFTGRRRAQLKLLRLKSLDLIAGWRCFVQPGFHPRPSVYVLSAAGARLVAQVSQVHPRLFVDYARHARGRAFHLPHDLEVNSFFVGLASASRHLEHEGLYHWAGERRCRVVSVQHGVPTSDGWGRYLLPDGEVLFDLEWDRGTEQYLRLKRKASAYVSYFRGRRGASERHVLFVAPTDSREGEIDRAVLRSLPQVGQCCRFWTTNVALLDEAGPLGRIWHGVGPSPGNRVAIHEVPLAPRSNRPVTDCIGKQRWWERRRQGGEGA